MTKNTYTKNILYIYPPGKCKSKTQWSVISFHPECALLKNTRVITTDENTKKSNPLYTFTSNGN